MVLVLNTSSNHVLYSYKCSKVHDISKRVSELLRNFISNKQIFKRAQFCKERDNEVLTSPLSSENVK